MLALVTIIVFYLIIWGLTKLQQFNFELKIVKLTTVQDVDTRLFSLLAVTENKFSLENLIGYSASTNGIKAAIDKPINLNLNDKILSELKQMQNIIPNFKFSLVYDGKEYLQVLSTHNIIIPKNSPIATYLIPLPYNPNSNLLTAEANLVTWS